MNFLNFEQKIFGRVVKTTFYVSRGTCWEFLCEKKYIFFESLSKKLRQGCQTLLRIQRNILAEKLPEKKVYILRERFSFRDIHCDENLKMSSGTRYSVLPSAQQRECWNIYREKKKTTWSKIKMVIINYGKIINYFEACELSLSRIFCRRKGC